MPNPDVTIDLVGRDKRFQGTMKRVQNVLKRVRERMEGVSRTARRMLLVGGAAMAGFLKLAAKQEAAEKGLDAALQASGQSVEEWSGKLRQAASALQQVTTVGDEAALEYMMMATNLGVTADQLDHVTRMSLGLAKAVGVDVKMAMRGFILATQGEYTLLNRYIPALRTATSDTEKLAAVNRVASRGFEQLKAETETFTGALKQMGNALGDVGEKLGTAVMGRVKDAIKWLKGFATDIDGWIARNKELAETLGDVALAVGAVTAAVAALTAALAGLGLAAAGVGALATAWGKIAVAVKAIGPILARIGPTLVRGGGAFTIGALIGEIAKVVEGHREAMKQAAKDAGFYRERLASIDDIYKELAKDPTLANQLRAYQAIHKIMQQLVSQLGDAYQPMLDSAARKVEEIQKRLADMSSTKGASVDPFGWMRGIGDILRGIAELDARGRDFNDSLEEQARRIREATKSTQERLAEELRLLETLKAQGLITEKQYNRARKQAADRAADRDFGRTGTIEGLTATYRRIREASVRRPPKNTAAATTAKNTAQSNVIGRAIERAVRDVLKWLQQQRTPVGVYGA